MRDDESRDGCCEPETAVSFARNAESSSDSFSLRRVYGRVMYREKNVSVAVMEVKSSSTSQEDLNTNCTEYARTGFLKCVIVHGGGGECSKRRCHYGVTRAFL